jgi:hypothetical protein
MSAEKVQAFVERFPTPIGFYEEIKARRMQEEAEAEEEPPAKKRKKADSAELWIMKEAGKEGSRGIKQKLSSDTYKIWVRLRASTGFRADKGADSTFLLAPLDGLLYQSFTAGCVMAGGIYWVSVKNSL